MGNFVKLQPKPGLVAKTRTAEDGTKVFINICSDDQVPAPPQGYDKKTMSSLDDLDSVYVIPAALGDLKPTTDKSGAEAAVMDCVVHSSLIRQSYTWPMLLTRVVCECVEQLATRGVTLDISVLSFPKMHQKGELENRTVQVPEIPPDVLEYLNNPEEQNIQEPELKDNSDGDFLRELSSTKGKSTSPRSPQNSIVDQLPNNASKKQPTPLIQVISSTSPPPQEQQSSAIDESEPTSPAPAASASSSISSMTYTIKPFVRAAPSENNLSGRATPTSSSGPPPPRYKVEICISTGQPIDETGTKTSTTTREHDATTVPTVYLREDKQHIDVDLAAAKEPLGIKLPVEAEHAEAYRVENSNKIQIFVY